MNKYYYPENIGCVLLVYQNYRSPTLEKKDLNEQSYKLFE